MQIHIRHLSHQESPLNKSHSYSSHYFKTTNHNQGTLLFLCRCSQTHTHTHTHTHTKLFPDKGLWLGLVCGLLLSLYWRQWDSVQYTCPTTKHRAALWRDAITWLWQPCCNPSLCPHISSSLSPTITSLCFHLSPSASIVLSVDRPLQHSHYPAEEISKRLMFRQTDKYGQNGSKRCQDILNLASSTALDCDELTD